MANNDSVIFKVRLSRAELAFLRAHAYRRDVHVSRLAADILVSWIRRATPANDPLFKPGDIGYYTPEMRAEPYKDYFLSLRFQPEQDVKPADFTEPPPMPGIPDYD